MPMRRYDAQFGGKPGAATEAYQSMVKQYGLSKGKRVFYASVNKRKKAKSRGGGSESRTQ